LLRYGPDCSEPSRHLNRTEISRLETGHRYLPLLDGFIFAQDGTEGWDVAFYNDAPGPGEVEPLATYVAASTRFRINDHKPEGDKGLWIVSMEQLLNWSLFRKV
jgi:hypothetical protein